ncbi:MAG: hypothetical protein QHG99_01270 [Methanomicrobiales archaeon]|nr:hypothetical protein [Methanomicrobiales archaeon]
MALKNFLSVLLLLSLVTGAGGHVPLSVTGEEALSDAVLVKDPEKSWVVYDEIEEGGGIRYFKVEMRGGGELRLSLFVPEPSRFIPDLIIIFPGEGDDTAITPIPEGYAAELIPGRYPEEPEFEPFTPSVLYPLAEYSRIIEHSGTWYIAVREPYNGGKFGLAIGYREEFTPSEWLLVPFSVIGIRLWEGQPTLLIIAPFFAAILAGLMVLRRTGILTNIGWKDPAVLGISAGLLCLGSAGITGAQTIMALMRTGWTGSAWVTLLFLLIPLLLGIAMINTSRKYALMPSRTVGLTMGIWGVLALLFWAGFIAGPILAIVSTIRFFARR